VSFMVGAGALRGCGLVGWRINRGEEDLIYRGFGDGGLVEE
jgi:hypothetical protein